jgi:hypothetical protein
MAARAARARVVTDSQRAGALKRSNPGMWRNKKRKREVFLPRARRREMRAAEVQKRANERTDVEAQDVERKT